MFEIDRIKAEKLKTEANSIADAAKSARRGHRNGTEVNTVRRRYNKFREKFNEFIKNNSNEESELSIDKVPSTAAFSGGGEMLDVVTNAEAAASALIKYEETSLDSKQEKKIKYSREGLSELDKMPIFKEDLSKSLDLLERGYYLGSVLIAGRLIDYSFSKILKDVDLQSGESKVEGIVRKLEEDDEIYESSDGKIVQALRTYRNLYSHNPGAEPDSDKSIMIIAGTIDYLKTLQKSDYTAYS